MTRAAKPRNTVAPTVAYTRIAPRSSRHSRCPAAAARRRMRLNLPIATSLLHRTGRRHAGAWRCGIARDAAQRAGSQRLGRDYGVGVVAQDGQLCAVSVEVEEGILGTE